MLLLKMSYLRLYFLEFYSILINDILRGGTADYARIRTRCYPRVAPGVLPLQKEHLRMSLILYIWHTQGCFAIRYASWTARVKTLSSLNAAF